MWGCIRIMVKASLGNTALRESTKVINEELMFTLELFPFSYAQQLVFFCVTSEYLNYWWLQIFHSLESSCLFVILGNIKKKRCGGQWTFKFNKSDVWLLTSVRSVFRETQLMKCNVGENASFASRRHWFNEYTKVILLLPSHVEDDKWDLCKTVLWKKYIESLVEMCKGS